MLTDVDVAVLTLLYFTLHPSSLDFLYGKLNLTYKSVCHIN